MRRTLTSLVALTFAAITGCAPAQKTAELPKPTVVAVAAPDAPAKPPLKASELVKLEASAANKLVKSGDASEITVRLRVRAQAIKDAPRPNINLGLVVDTSGSMEGKAIEDAKAASLALVE